MATAHRRLPKPAWRRLTAYVIGRAVGQPCPKCRQPIDPVGTWPPRHPLSPSVDHVVPLSVDPSRAQDPSNLRAMHYGCNSARGDGTHDTVRRTW